MTQTKSIYIHIYIGSTNHPQIASTLLEKLLHAKRWIYGQIAGLLAHITHKHAHTHTCSETSLRILLWSASFVHKTIPTNWQERLVDSTRTSVRSMLSTSLLWGRFWCSRTIHIWSKVIPDCDNSAVKRKFKWTTWRFLGWASSHFWKNWQVRMADQAMYHQGKPRASSLVVDSGPCYHPLL